MTELSSYDRIRYDRQIQLFDWGEEGQIKVKSARVFIAGAGGLGSPVSLYLAAAGVGEIHICDADNVELSNLNRQILHTDERIGELKADSAAKTLHNQNPAIRVRAYPEYLTAKKAERIIGKPDIVVDCLDNYETRYVLNDYCIEQQIPLVHAAVWGLIGQLTFLSPPETPCLKCIVPESPSKTASPVVGATPGVIGSLQAIEVLKYLTGSGRNLKGTMLLFDGEEMTFTPLVVRRAAACLACGGLSQ